MNGEWVELKKDWVYQRKKTFIFKSWNPRYMVIYSKPCPALALYEQRSDSVPPYAPMLHLELTPQLRIEKWGNISQDNNNCASFASSHYPDDSNFEQRRGSITSLVPDHRVSKSKKHLEENAIVISRPATENQPSLKV